MKKLTALILSLWALSPAGAKPNILFIAVDD